MKKKTTIGVVAGVLAVSLCVMFAWALPFTETGSMSIGGAITMTMLQDGTVLVTGGFDGNDALNIAQIYNSGPGTFSATTGTMTSARHLHSATSVTVSAASKVLIAGGLNATLPSSALNTAELYDVSAETFSALSDTMASARYSHTSTLLSNGKVLITGGNDDGDVSLSTAEVFDPSVSSFATTSTDMSAARYLHSAVSLDGAYTGVVLITGGQNGTAVALNTAETYNISDDSFATVATMQDARYAHTSTLLANGKVLITGGKDASNAALSTAEIYDPALNTFVTTTGSMISPRYGHTATLLDNGKVLIASGNNGSTALSTAEVFDPATGLFQQTTVDMTIIRYDHQAVLLQNNKVLIAGGYFAAYSPLSTAELFDRTENVNATATTLASSSAGNMSFIGETVTFTATVVRSAGTATATGSVVFKDNGSTMGTSAVTAGGTATYVKSGLLLDTHNITAEYSGDENYIGSTSDTLTQIVSKYTTTTGVSTNKSSGAKAGEFVTFTATVSRGSATIYPVGGTVTFMYADGTIPLSPPRTVGGGIATYATSTLDVNIGSYDVIAVYSGDARYETSTSSSIIQTVSKYATTTALSTPRSSTKKGESLTFTAVVSSETSTSPARTGGTVSFMEGLVTLGTGTIYSSNSATFITTSLPEGVHLITALFNGDDTAGKSAASPLSSELTQTVSLYTATAALAASRTSTEMGDPITFTATVTRETTTAPSLVGGTVSFIDGLTTLGTSTIYTGGTATLATSGLLVGVHSVQAKYNADSNYSESGLSSAVTTTVSLKPTTMAISSPGASKIGESVTFTATVSQLTSTATCTYLFTGGTVTFYNGGTLLGPATVVSGPTDTFGLATLITSASTFTVSGDYAITADYGGDAHYALSSAPTYTQIVDKQDATITLDESSLNQTYSSSAKVVTATTNPPGLTVAYTFSPTPPISAGTYTVTALISSPTRTGSATGTLTIAKKALTITGMKANTKVYDGTLTSTITTTPGALVGVQGSDILTFTAAGAFATKTVGVGKPVSVATVTLVGATKDNYTVTLPTDVTGTITAKNLTVTGMTALNKTYDHSKSATYGTYSTLNGIVSNPVNTVTIDSVVMAFVSASTGTAKPVTVTSIVLGGDDGANYTVTKPTDVTANITPAPLSITAIAKNRPYDGSLKSSVTFTDNRYSGDNFTISAAAASFLTPTVGNSKTVNVTGITLKGTDIANYTFSTTATATANIQPKQLTIKGIKADTKVYDGTNVATFLSTTTRGSLSGVMKNLVTNVTDSVLFSVGTSTYATVTAGTSKLVNVGQITLSGTDAGNYTVATPRVTGIISPKPLTISGLAVNSRPYNRSTAATIDTSSAVLSEVVTSPSDSVMVGTVSAAFADKNAGTAKPVVISKIFLVGTNASNYSTITPTTLTGVISKLTLTVSATGKSKTYDRTTAATLIFSDSRLSGDSLKTTATATFDDKTAAGAKHINVGPITISGIDAGNYETVPVFVSAPTATIMKKALTIKGLKADTKVYNGATTATFLNSGTLSGLVTGDTVTFSVGNGAFNSKSVGSGKPVTLGAITWGGADADNYTITTPTRVTGTITARPLTVTATGIDKAYDGSTSADVTFDDDRVSGDDLTISGTAAFADATIGTAKEITVTAITKTGTDKNNYNFLVSSPTLTTSANIF